jgi:hypothetical protein
MINDRTQAAIIARRIHAIAKDIQAEGSETVIYGVDSMATYETHRNH